MIAVNVVDTETNAPIGRELLYTQPDSEHVLRLVESTPIAGGKFVAHKEKLALAGYRCVGHLQPFASDVVIEIYVKQDAVTKDEQQPFALDTKLLG